MNVVELAFAIGVTTAWAWLFNYFGVPMLLAALLGFFAMVGTAWLIGLALRPILELPSDELQSTANPDRKQD
jgi:hypothetical protein